MYYKDHSADWWRKNGLTGFFGSYMLSATEAFLIFSPLIEGFKSSTLIWTSIFLAFAALLLQMFLQKYSTTYLKYGIYAKLGENNIPKSVCFKHTMMTLWAWTVDFALFAVLFGSAFSSDMTVIMCGLPVIAGICLIIAILATIWTVKAKKEAEKEKKKEDDAL